MFDALASLLFNIFTVSTHYEPDFDFSGMERYGETTPPSGPGWYKTRTRSFCQLVPEYSLQLQEIMDNMYLNLNKTPEGQKIAYNIKQIEPCVEIVIGSTKVGVAGSTGFIDGGNVRVVVDNEGLRSLDDYSQLLVHELTHAVDLIDAGYMFDNYNDCRRSEARALRAELIFIEGAGTNGLTTLDGKWEIKNIDKDDIREYDIALNSDCEEKFGISEKFGTP